MIKGEHSHLPDSRMIGKKRMMTKIKRMAKRSSATSKRIITKCLKKVKKSVAAIIPPANQLRNLVNRARKNPDFPANPNTLSELILTPEFCKTERDENFLLFDSGTIELEDKSEKRLVIFGTQSNLQFMAECTELFMDGTFKVTPRLFNQLYTIHGE